VEASTHGTRIETDSQGRVLVAAPSDETLLGSLAVAEHLGGGYVHWSRGDVFRSSRFTGPLERVTLPKRPERNLLGARNGLTSVLVVSHAEAYALGPGREGVQPVPHLALADIAALDERRALVLDTFGRTRATSDGGVTWRDLTSVLGLAPSHIGVTDRAIWVRTDQGDFELTGEPLGEPTPVSAVRENYKPGELRHSNARRLANWHPRWGHIAESLLASAVRGGVALPDGTALGIASQRIGRVDLETGETVEQYAASLHNGLTCRPHAAADGVLFACRWEQYQYYGAYVLWSEQGMRPRVEKAFSDDGVFIGTDDGALAYTGSCQATPRYVEGGRFHGGSDSLSSTICVRRGRGTWSERRLPDVVIDRWVPSVDGTAVAFVRAGDPSLAGLVARVDTPPSMSVRGVRIWDLPHVDDDLEILDVDAGEGGIIERNFTVHSDGVVAGWANRMQAGGRVRVGIESTPSGRVTTFEPPPNTENTIVTGRFGLARSHDGQVFETQDHGRTWAAAEDSPVGAAAFHGSCSKLGCVLSSFVRVGWGAASLDVRNAATENEASARDGSSGLVPLRCAPRGRPSIAPTVEGEMAAQVSGSRGTRVATGYGDTVRVVQLAVDETASSESPDDGAREKKHRPSVATHAVVWTPPFGVDTPPRALGAVLPDEGRRNVATIPLLDDEGQVALLVLRDKEELLIQTKSVEVWPAYEEGRGFWRRNPPSGGLLSGGFADVTLMVNQRPSLERHGFRSNSVPRFFGLTRSLMQGRAMAVAAGPHGSRALLALNRPRPDPVAVAAIRSHGDLGPAVGLASWRDALALGDARCPAKGTGYRALLVIDPAAWFSIDGSALPDVRLGHQGLVLVHWGRSRVCVEAMRLSVAAERHAAGASAIVARFGGRGGGASAALRTDEVIQHLHCGIGGIREP